MLVCYHHVSARDQNPAQQIAAVKATGGERAVMEKFAGAKCERDELQAALDYTRVGGTVVVCRLDLFARAVRQLVEIVENLRHREVGLEMGVRASALNRDVPRGRCAQSEAA